MAAICTVKDSGLCPTCIKLGLPTYDGGNETRDGSTMRIVELCDLCRPCVRRLRSCFICTINARRHDIIGRVQASSAWWKKNPFVGRSDENDSL